MCTPASRHTSRWRPARRPAPRLPPLAARKPRSDGMRAHCVRLQRRGSRRRARRGRRGGGRPHAQSSAGMERVMVRREGGGGTASCTPREACRAGHPRAASRRAAEPACARGRSRDARSARQLDDRRAPTAPPLLTFGLLGCRRSRRRVAVTRPTGSRPACEAEADESNALSSLASAACAAAAARVAALDALSYVQRAAARPRWPPVWRRRRDRWRACGFFSTFRTHDPLCCARGRQRQQRGWRCSARGRA